MNKVWKILIVILLGICAISLSINTYISYQTSLVDASRAELADSLRTSIVKSLEDIDATRKAYKDAAYGGSVDRIAEQQLMATETTNELLAHLSGQIALLAQIIK